MTDRKALSIGAPLSGWCLPLEEVPDPVFARRMAGDGAAIDPTSDTVVAPCDGILVTQPRTRHAITVRHDSGIEVMVHVGIDTVALGGEGFEMLAGAGDRVRAGDRLLRFDLDAVARRAPSLVTPVVIAAGGRVVTRVAHRLLRAGEVLLEVVPGEPAEARAEAGPGEARREFRIPFEHGLHVRPAAQILAALRPFSCEVAILAHGRTANAKSAVAMMALGVACGELVDVRATGKDAQRALAALASLLLPPREFTPAAPEEPSAPFTVGRIEALVASRGLAAGPVARWSQSACEVTEAGRGEALESGELDEAVGRVASHLESAARSAPGEHRAVLEAHRELLRDPDIERRAREELKRGRSAAFAWRAATRETAATLAAMSDERMRERAADLRDLEGLVLRTLAGEPLADHHRFAPGSIVIADELLPSHLAALQRDGVQGFCTARGGPTSHVALLAAAAGLPALVAAGPRVLAIPEGTPVALDAEHGWLDVGLAPSERGAFERAIGQRAAERGADLAAAQRIAETRDRVRIIVNANLGSLAEVAGAVEAGAEGCGLLRTEFLFLDRREAPTPEEQLREYQAIASALGGRPLAVRTLDVGGDKPIAYLSLPHEENPALGLRGVRATLASPALLEAQLRAIVRVRPSGQCRVLVPMVTEIEELQRVRHMLEEIAHAEGAQVPALGAMIETPGAALIADALAQTADFLSLGTNDLAQYTLAIDRGHPRLGPRLDALHPAVLRLVSEAARAAHARGKVASVCGALASDVDALPILVGLGIREISATPAAIPRLKRTVRLLDAAECAELADRALGETTAAAVRELAAMARSRARAAAQSTLGGTP